MNDFRIKVFLSVAQNLSFTKASSELGVSQPAISSHIKEIETMYNVQLFERVKNTICLTSQGRLFLRYAQGIDREYEELEFQMSIAAGDNKGELIIGASATIADYILPSLMANYMSNFPEVKLSLVRGSSERIEQLVSEQKVDIGFVEDAIVGVIEDSDLRPSLNSSLLYCEELVLVKSYDNRKIGGQISIPELTRIPLVLEERGASILNIVLGALKSNDIEYEDLNVKVHLESVESIKSFICCSDNFTILPISSIRSELLRHELLAVEIVDLKFHRDLSILYSISPTIPAAKFAQWVSRIIESR